MCEMIMMIIVTFSVYDNDNVDHCDIDGNISVDNR